MPNLLKQQFEASHSDETCVADITYVRTLEGWLYLVVVPDLYKRKVVGHATSSRLAQVFVLDALGRAIALRRPGAVLVHHSDRGSQQASHAHMQMLKDAGITPSVSGSGNCCDNSVRCILLQTNSDITTQSREVVPLTEEQMETIEFLLSRTRKKTFEKYEF